MKKRLLRLLAKSIVWLLSLRYNIEFKNEEVLDEPAQGNAGFLFLSNHPAFIDPLINFTRIWERFSPRPVVTEYVYEMPVLKSVFKQMRSLPVPDFEVSGSSLKRQRGERSYRRLAQGLRRGDNFIINPAGRLKLTGVEMIGGASWVHRLIQDVPEANVILIRITGLWGSMFSRALTGKSPPLFTVLKQAFWILIKNGIFFLPKRKVTVEFYSPKKEFPRDKPRLEMNRYLEDWYNRYEGGQASEDGRLEEPLKLVSYSCWQEELPEVRQIVHQEEDDIDLSQIPLAVRQNIIHELSRMAKMPEESIRPEMHLANDLGLDSLDGAELVLFLDDRYDVTGVRPQDLNSVGQLMAIAAGQVEVNAGADDEDIDDVLPNWHEKWKRPPVMPPEGRTLQEAFLRTCDRMKDSVACADKTSGVLTFRQLKMRVLLLANEIRHLPGDHVGIMMPATIAANVAILACLLAGKVPVMINWTVGSKHLESCIQQAGIHVIISSRKFTDELEGVDLKPISPLFWMLEDLKEKIGIVQKIHAFVQSYRKADALLDEWNAWYVDEDSSAAILFTSGTEAKPKGVPLSHRNILSNHRAAFAVVPINATDVLYGMLPPFHSFGFSVTGLMPLLSGLRVVYTPNPTDSIRLARGIDEWGITIVCSAPTFLKGIIHAANPEQLRTVHLFLSGAEKAPPELVESITSLGAGKCLIEGYGITECSPILTINRPGKPIRGVGQPLPNVQIQVVHPETHELLEQGERGLIVVRGPNIFAGYLDPNVKSPFLTLDGKRWYITGDLGHLDEEGYLILSGRLKRFVKIGGEMISLGSIEEVLLTAAPKMSWPPHGKGPILATVAKEEAGQRPELHLYTSFSTTKQEINDLLKDGGLSNLARINEVHQIESIPLTGTGKIAYRELGDKLTSLA